MMQHLIILPIVLPMFTGLFMLLNRNGATHPRRLFAMVSTSLLVVVGILLLIQSNDDVVRYYALGDWQPPFGIILVLDRLSAMMVLLTAVLALGSVIYACAGDDEQGSNFHGLFQLQLMGVNGAFLTGDLFNLFVFFEVLLIASYALLIHGGGKTRIHSSFHYVALNLAGSALFLIAVGTLYGVTGTLNMADMAQRIPMLEASQASIAQVGAMLLLVVFGLKAAMLPLYFWLPRAYAAAPAPVAALFVIMSKVGIYGILRIYTLIFGTQAGVLADIAQPWAWWLGLATLVLGSVGVLAARDLRTQVSYLILISIGTLLAGIGINTQQATSALLYYLIHTTLVTGGLFLLADVIARQRGKAGARIVRSRAVTQVAPLGVLFFVGAMAVIGMPPLSGAIGKTLLMQSANAPEYKVWLWAILLGSSLVSVVALSRAGSTVFWRANRKEETSETMGALRGVAMVLLIGASPLISLLAGPVAEFTEATAAQLSDTQRYIQAILPADTAGGDA
ncbi:monovalent cation/H+ antiporter subunit D [Modicisalibacter xianhensis]|uniref:Multisubunit potassium/proton antiporter, PhaD subunit n=1 Tax=Modicisalibacter xianhensis TaxID=442341 RepID=A0A1I3DVQ6_9GAMM|nr:monovalent cation/H+ antiporter subunit D [Halomonas xianhensis]SFH90810.1 multisubunit potassium/proton antiporter, PhaD subunit [Halomonas xianhensis]